jgi:O-antigen ligase
MKLFGMVLLAGFISLICGVAVTSAASSIMPCYSDKAGCGMGEAYRLLVVPGYALFAMIGFGIAAPGKYRERALKLAMLVLVLVAVFVIALGMASDANSGRSPNAGDLIDAVQMSVSYWVVVIVQWLMLRRYLRLREAEREAIS